MAKKVVKSDARLRLDAIAEAVALMVAGIEEEQLGNALMELHGLTSTNCWYVLYGLRVPLIRMVGDRLDEIERLRLSQDQDARP